MGWVWIVMTVLMLAPSWWGRAALADGASDLSVDPAAEAARLEAELEVVEGRERLRLVTELVSIYRRIAPARALEFGDEVQNLQVQEHLTPQVEGRLLTDLSDSAYITGQTALALRWAYFALREADQAEYQWGRAQALWRLARIHGTRLEFESALMTLEEVLEIARELDSPELMSAYYSTLALAYDYKGHTLDSREALYESLEYARRGDDEFLKGLALLNMGFDYSEQEEAGEAADYLADALQLFRERGDVYYIAATLEVLAGVRHAQGKSGEALMIITEAQQLGDKLGTSEVVGRTLLQLAQIQFDLGHEDSALRSLDRGLAMWHQTENEPWLSAGLARKGKYLLAQGKPEEALEMLREAEEMLLRLGRDRVLMPTILDSARALEALERHGDALAAYRRYEDLRVEQAERGNQGRIEELQARFESAEKDRAIADLELTQVLDRAKLTRERGLRRLLLTSAVLLAGTVLAVALAYFTQRRGRVELQNAYSRLDTAHQALEAHSAEIRELVREKEELFALAADDLRVPVVSIRELSKDLQEQLQQVPGALEGVAMAEAAEAERQQLLQLVDGDMPQEIGRIREATQRLEVLVDGLLKLYRLSRNEMESRRVEVGRVVERVVTSFSLEIEDTGAVVRVAKLPVVTADPAALETIFSHLVHNALLYRDPERPLVIEVSCERRRGETVFHVGDNGRGIAVEDLDRVFKVFARVGPRGSGGEGIGLAAARTLVRRHGGFLWCESKLGEGSTFSFSLPDEPRHATITIPRSTPPAGSVRPS